MIFGIGTDIVELDRVKNLSNLDKFSKKILSTNEIIHFKTLNSEERIRYLAKQFVAKESVAKAIRQGFNKKIKISSIEILRDSNGAPICNLTNNTCNLKLKNIHISLSDEEKYAIGFAILEI